MTISRRSLFKAVLGLPLVAALGAPPLAEKPAASALGFSTEDDEVNDSITTTISSTGESFMVEYVFTWDSSGLHPEVSRT